MGRVHRVGKPSRTRSLIGMCTKLPSLWRPYFRAYVAVAALNLATSSARTRPRSFTLMPSLLADCGGGSARSAMPWSIPSRPAYPQVCASGGSHAAPGMSGSQADLEPSAA